MFRLLSRPLRLPAFLGPAPRPDDPQIFRFNSERGPIIGDVVRRVVQHYAGQPQKLLYVLNEAGNAEVRRLAMQDDLEASDALGAWRRLVKRLGKMNEDEKVQELRRITGDMAEDIAGNFDPRVYALATRIVPGVLTAIMKPSSLPQQLLGGFRQLGELVSTEGPIEKLRRRPSFSSRSTYWPARNCSRSFTSFSTREAMAASRSERVRVASIAAASPMGSAAMSAICLLYTSPSPRD